MSGAAKVFDRAALRRHRERAAARLGSHDFLLRAVAENLAERLSDVRRRFPRVLDLGRRGGGLGPVLAARAGTDLIVQAEMSPALLSAARGLPVVADEERLPFAYATFDLVVSLLSLHWINDLPGTLIQIRRGLRSDGLFLAAMLGGETLGEIRHALALAERAEEGGLSPRVAPFVDVRAAGGLLQRAGFALPVVDIDTITATYPNAMALMRELRAMGESNALLERRRRFTRRATLARAAAIYQERFATADGRLPATFQVLTLTAWKSHESQPRPLARGSAKRRLRDAL